MLGRVMEDTLIWLPEKGMGYYPVKGFPYDDKYFNKYKCYANTVRGDKLTNARISFVNKHYSGVILDVGIGSGQFVLARRNTFGFDVNPAGVKWLEAHELYRDLYEGPGFEALCFWDSLEHIEDPEKAIAQAKEFVFASMPIFNSLEDLQKSKHFRKDEHFWYFTHEGLVNWFNSNGFSLVEVNNEEIKLGREGILSYCFRRN